MSGRSRRWAWVAAAVACCGVLALVTVPAVLTSIVAGGCDVGYQSAGSGSGSWLATAYGPPWGGIEGGGVTATGINLTAGQPMLEVAVDPHVIALGSFVHVQPNPFATVGAFYAGDTGGAIVGRHVDIYDWLGRAAQDAWGARHVNVTPAASPGTGNALGQVQARVLARPSVGGDCVSSSAGGYRNPFASSASVVPGRIDMGVDYDGAGPIDALGAGTVTYSASGGAGWGPFLCSGGHGGAVVYRLADGPDGGRYVYVSEGIIPLVTVGERVQAGQPVASFTGCIETGWGTGAGAGPMAAAVGQACSSGDPGCVSTACGWGMSQLIKASGGPPGIVQGTRIVMLMARRARDSLARRASRSRPVIVMLAAAGALLVSGCGLTDPYSASSSNRAAPGTTVTIAAGEHDGPAAPPPATVGAGAAEASPAAALSRYARLYVNWSWATVAADERRLATLSVGQAHAQALAAAARPERMLARYRVRNEGEVVAIAAGRGVERGRWVVVSDERTSGDGPYEGLPARSHVTWATVQRTGSGWVVSGWYPGS